MHPILLLRDICATVPVLPNICHRRCQLVCEIVRGEAGRVQLGRLQLAHLFGGYSSTFARHRLLRYHREKKRVYQSKQSHWLLHFGFWFDVWHADEEIDYSRVFRVRTTEA